MNKSHSGPCLVALAAISLAGGVVAQAPCDPTQGTVESAPPDYINSRCAISDNWRVATPITVSVGNHVFGAGSHHAGVAFSLDAEDRDEYVLACIRDTSTTTIGPVTACDTLSFSYTLSSVPFMGGTLVDADRSTAVLVLPEDLPPSAQFDVLVNCLVSDVGSDECGAGDPSKVVTWSFQVVTNSCRIPTIGAIAVSVPIQGSGPPLTPSVGPCCTGSTAWHKGAPLTAGALSILNSGGLPANTTTLDHPLLIASNASDEDELTRSCDDTPNCPDPWVTRHETIPCDDHPSVSWTSSRLTGQGASGAFLLSVGPETAAWIAPTSGPGQFTICCAARNRQCNAADEECVPLDAPIAVRSVDLKVEGQSTYTTTWTEYRLSLAALADVACGELVTVVNDDNDDQGDTIDLQQTSGIPGENDLAVIKVHADDDLRCRVSCSTGGATHFRLWNEADRTGLIPLNTWQSVASLRDSDQVVRIYVEGLIATPGSSPPVLSVEIETSPGTTWYGLRRVASFPLVVQGIGSIDFLSSSGDGSSAQIHPWTAVPTWQLPEGFASLPPELANGRYIFPDALLFQDSPSQVAGVKHWYGNHRDKVKVRLSIAPPRAGVTVYVRSFDVDDNTLPWAFPDDETQAEDNGGHYYNALDQPIPGWEHYYAFPTRPSGYVARSIDPVDPDPANRPKPLLTLTTAGDGTATFYFIPSAVPGDNYRVVASLDSTHLHADTGSCKIHAAQSVGDAHLSYNGLPPLLQQPALPTTSSGAQAVATPWLTVRRKIQFELDHATATVLNTTSDAQIHDNQSIGLRRYATGIVWDDSTQPFSIRWHFAPINGLPPNSHDNSLEPFLYTTSDFHTPETDGTFQNGKIRLLGDPGFSADSWDIARSVAREAVTAASAIPCTVAGQPYEILEILVVGSIVRLKAVDSPPHTAWTPNTEIRLQGTNTKFTVVQHLATSNGVHSYEVVQVGQAPGVLRVPVTVLDDCIHAYAALGIGPAWNVQVPLPCGVKQTHMRNGAGAAPISVANYLLRNTCVEVVVSREDDWPMRKNAANLLGSDFGAVLPTSQIASSGLFASERLWSVNYWGSSDGVAGADLDPDGEPNSDLGYSVKIPLTPSIGGWGCSTAANAIMMYLEPTMEHLVRLGAVEADVLGGSAWEGQTAMGTGALTGSFGVTGLKAVDFFSGQTLVHEVLHLLVAPVGPLPDASPYYAGTANEHDIPGLFRRQEMPAGQSWNTQQYYDANVVVDDVLSAANGGKKVLGIGFLREPSEPTLEAAVSPFCVWYVRTHLRFLGRPK